PAGGLLVPSDRGYFTNRRERRLGDVREPKDKAVPAVCHHGHPGAAVGGELLQLAGIEVRQLRPRSNLAFARLALVATWRTSSGLDVEQCERHAELLGQDGRQRPDLLRGGKRVLLASGFQQLGHDRPPIFSDSW